MSDRPVALTGRFGLFADCLLTGVLTAVAALGVVTALPALAAACAVLRDRASHDRPVGVRRYASLVADALRGGPAGWLAPVLAAAVLGLDVLAVAAGAPGAGPLGALLVVAASAAMVVGLRAAGRWRPGLRWTAIWLAAARDTRRDHAGDALLWLAGVAAVAIAVTVPVSALLVGGPLALAAAAVDARRVDPAGA